MNFVLEMSDICKTFYGDGIEIRANDHINFNLLPGEIHTILGENGAGKSTLVGSLFHSPDRGFIKLNGQEVHLKNPTTALKYGLGIARQDLSKSLIERHSIAENILSISQGFFLSLKEISKKIKQTLREFDLGDLNPNTKVGKLSGGEKQRVEILKALITNPDVIILDEPTAMLTPNEVDSLFKLLFSLKERGKSIVLITHHLEEAIKFSDRITVLRNGKVVEMIDVKNTENLWSSQEEGIRYLANSMIGKEILYELSHSFIKPGKIVMYVEDLVVKNDMGDIAVNKTSFQLRENHILGLAGIAGNGQTEIVESILHWRKIESGRVFIHDVDVTNKSINDIRNLGVAYIPEDRNKALILDLTVRENLSLNLYRGNNRFFIDKNSVVSKTNNLVQRFNIKTTSPLVPIRTLSGGNRQKVVVAREVSITPPQNSNLILIAENPTFGLDIGTTQFVREELLQLREAGAAILLVSNDLTEILSLSDEVAVLYKGRITGTKLRDEFNRQKIGLLMGGSEIGLGA
ncbi:MAG: ABC transporter ATP-binding protein [Candidatus Thorarchaeota archaeon]